MPTNALASRSTRRSTRVATPALFVVASDARHREAPTLALDDHSCPRREVAVLSEVDSGYRWDEA